MRTLSKHASTRSGNLIWRRRGRVERHTDPFKVVFYDSVVGRQTNIKVTKRTFVSLLYITSPWCPCLCSRFT